MFQEFRGKLQKLTYFEFEGHDRHEGINLGLTESELLAELQKIPAGDLFLGRYTDDEIRDMFARHGVLKALAELGYPEVKIETATHNVYNHRLYVFVGVRDYDHMLMELRVREGIFRPREQFVPGIELGPLPMILIDWAMLQNPRRSFDEKRPALPQQRYPGLGLLPAMVPLVLEVVNETGRKGVLDVPDHYHSALFYSRWFKFFNPGMEGRFQALRRDLGQLPLQEVSRGFDHNCIIETKSGVVENWVPGEQLLPLSPELNNYFNSPGYDAIRRQAFEQAHYRFDRERFERKGEKHEP
jgi:hypothetical protein